MKKGILFPLVSLASVALAILACTPIMVSVNGEPLGGGDSDAPSSEVVSSEATEVWPADLPAAFEALPTGDAASGEDIFDDRACHTCHADLPIGPAFPGDPALATRAETRRAGYSAELYLYESIISPQVYVVLGYDGEVMPQDFGEELSAQDIADLIAYLMTMK